MGLLTMPIRRLFRRPTEQLWQLLSLASAIAVGTAVFAIVDQVFIRQVPGVSPQAALVSVRFRAGTGGTAFGAYAALPAYRETAASLGLVAIGASCCKDTVEVAVPGSAASTAVTADFVTGGYFEALGITPRIGRLFSEPEAERGLERLAVVSESLWQNMNGGTDTRNALLFVNGRTFQIIGVATGFRGWGQSRYGIVDVWLPIAAQSETVRHGSAMSVAIGRLRRAEDADRVERQLRTTHASLTVLSDRQRQFIPFLEHGLWPLNRSLEASQTVRSLLTVFVAMIGILACSNVMTRILTEFGKRRQVIAIQVALGATWRRIVAEWLAEALIVSVGATVAGVVLTRLVLGALSDLRVGAALPPISYVGLDRDVVLYAGGAALVAVFGSRALPLMIALAKGHGVGSTRITARGAATTRWLLSLQLAISVALVASAVAITVSLRTLLATDLGFNPDKVVQLSIPPSPLGQSGDAALAQRIRDSLGARGFTRSAIASIGPLDDMNTRVRFRVGGSADQSFDIREVSIKGDYFGVMAIPFHEGQTLDTDDERDSIVPVVTSSSLALRLFGVSAGAVGRTFEFDSSGASNWLVARIVGVVSDSQPGGARAQLRPTLYHTRTTTVRQTAVFVRVVGPQDRVGKALAEATHDADPTAGLLKPELLSDELNRRFSEERLLLAITLIVSGSGLLLAAAGVVAVVRQILTERRREFGIRAALGASPAMLVRLTLSSLTAPAGLGIVVGCLLYAGCNHWLRAYTFGVGAANGFMMAIAAVLVGVLGVLSACTSSLSAARESPALALGQQ